MSKVYEESHVEYELHAAKIKSIAAQIEETHAKRVKLVDSKVELNSMHLYFLHLFNLGIFRKMQDSTAVSVSLVKTLSAGIYKAKNEIEYKNSKNLKDLRVFLIFILFF